MFLVLLVGVQHLQAQKVWDGSIADGFESGSGTKESPYEIQTPEQFAYFIQAINKGETFYEKEIVMTRDISMNNIALGANYNTCFSGTFNGLGHIIYDMKCGSYTYSSNAQMFYSLEGVICNLAVKGTFISTSSSAFVQNVTSLGIIYNCKLNISMTVDEDDVFYFFACQNAGSIVDCAAYGGITCSAGRWHEGRYYEYETEDGEYHVTLGNIFGKDNTNGKSIAVGSAEKLEEWLSCHPEVNKVSCDYTEPTCTIEITDPEGVVVSPNISARNGISFGGISLPTTGFDCTVTGYTWRGKSLDKNAVIDREIVNVYPVYSRTIKEQPTSENPTIVVDDKAHAQYNWYKRADLFGDWEYSKESSTNACKSFNINVEAGDVLSFYYYLNDAEEYSDYFIVTLDGAPICSKSGNGYGDFEYYFPTSGTHTLEFKIDLKSTNDVSLYVYDIRNTNEEELLIDNNTTNTLFVNGNNIENGAEYYCKVTYTNSSTILYSNPFVAIKEEAEGDTDIIDIANTIYFDNIEAFCGKTIELPIKMKNDIVATGFQFDIILPEGITAEQDEEGFYDITLSTERTTATKTNTFDSSLMSDGSIRVLAASTRNYPFSGNDGEVCIIKLNVSEDLPAGDYPIILKNIELTNAQGQTWNVERLKRTITVKDYQLGDANGDGRVSVGDFSAVANHILGTTPEGFNLGAADANQDNNISVGDLSTIATMILTSENCGASKVRAKAPEELSDPNNYIYADPVVISEDGDATIVFNMKNKIAATGFQFNFKLPEGFEVTEDEDGFLDVFLSQIRTTSRKTNTFDCVPWEDGSYRVLAASTKNYEFSGNDGEVVTVHIKKKADVESGDYELLLTDIELTNASGQTFRNSKAVYTITVPSNSNEIALIDGEAYDNSTTTNCDALTFSKTFSASAAGKWNAFYVPMSVNVEEYAGELEFAEIYAFCAMRDTNGDGVVDASDENVLFVYPLTSGLTKPNVPYLIRPREAKTYVINSADNVLYAAAQGIVEFSTARDKFTVTGLYEPLTVVAGDNNYYVSSTGSLDFRTTGSTTVKANRWVMHRESKEYGGGSGNAAASSTYRIVAIGEDIDEPTAIKMINAANEQGTTNVEIYSLDGRKVNNTRNLRNGLYIKNNQKIIVK